MSNAALPEAILIAEAVPSEFEAAAGLLEQAVRAGRQEPEALYLLALAHKRQGKPADARAALRKIARPDANVWLQLGILSLQDGQPAQAEQEFARAWEMDPACYFAGYNLLLTRLTLDKLGDAEALVPQVQAAAPSDAARHSLALLQALLRSSQGPPGDRQFEPMLLEMTEDDEQRLLRLACGLGQMDTVLTLLQTLAGARHHSPEVQEAYVEAVLVKGKALVDRGSWGEAERLLSPLLRRQTVTRETQAALLNLLGCCAVLNQDFDQGIHHFSAAVKLAGNGPRLHQNLALAHELRGDLAQAEPYWNRCFDLLESLEPVPEQLLFEGLNRLATLFSEKEKWADALPYVQRAQRLRPQDTDLLERLFHLYQHLRRTDDARRTLRRLRERKPREPQYDLFELDLVDVRTLSDIERLLGDIEAVRKRYPGDARVEERAVSMVGNVIPVMANRCDQLTDQLARVMDQVRHLPNYQIDWRAVHGTMRDLVREFQKLRRITRKCLPLVTSNEHKRVIRDLMDHIEKKIEVCESMGG